MALPAENQMTYYLFSPITLFTWTPPSSFITSPRPLESLFNPSPHAFLYSSPDRHFGPRGFYHSSPHLFANYSGRRCHQPHQHHQKSCHRHVEQHRRHPWRRLSHMHSVRHSQAIFSPDQKLMLHIRNRPKIWTNFPTGSQAIWISTRSSHGWATQRTRRKCFSRSVK